MDPKRLSVISGIVILVIATVASIYLSTAPEEEASQSPPDQAVPVEVITKSPSVLDNTIYFTGRVIPSQQFPIFAEVTGIMEETDKPFKTGTEFSRGQILLQINDEEDRQSLIAARYGFTSLLSRILPDIQIDYPEAYDSWLTFFDSIDAERPLPSLPEVDDSQLKLFLNNREIYQQYSSIRRQEVRLDKFTIRAPFNGVVTDHEVNPGALVRVNQSLGEFTSLQDLEIEATIPARQSTYINVGSKVRLRLNQPEASVEEVKIIRKNAKIDPATQRVRIYLSTGQSEVQPGDYLEGTIQGTPFTDAVRIHQDALIRDSEVFVVRDSIASLHTITVLAQRGDSATITDIPENLPIIHEFRDPSFQGTEVTPAEDQ